MRQIFQKFHLIRFGLLVFLTLSGLSAFSLSHAAGYTAFGPQVYLRQRGRPVIEEDSFVSAVSGSFTLKIYNGGLEGDEYDLVSSAEIYLNNTRILSPKELNQNVDYLDKTVTVQSVNDLSVELRGKPGAALVIEIEGDDAVFPVITSSIVPSANTNDWHLSDPTVSFNCSDVGSTIASCSTPVTVINEGVGQVIMGTAIDLAGNTTTVSETINLDKSLPVLSISSPASGITVAVPVIDIVGQVSDSISAVQLTVNNVAVTPGSGGSFSHPVTLVEGANEISVLATDVAGNANSTSLSILLISNQAPVASDQLVTINEDSSASIALTATDIDDDPLNYQVVVQPTNGSLSGVEPNLIYQPAANFSGSDHFSFAANDGQLDSDTATVSIHVNPVNDAPAIISTPVLVGQQDEPYKYQINAVDVELDALTYAVVTGPAAMTLNANGLVSWTPSQVDVGIHSIAFSVSDSNGGSTTQAYDLEIEAGQNTPPIITSTATTLVTIEQTYSYTVAADDVDGDVLTFGGVTLPNGMSVDPVSGELSWTPGQAEIGAHSVSVQVDDGNGGIVSHDFTLVVTATDLTAAAYMGTEFWIPRFNAPPETQLVISSEVDTSGAVEVIALQAQGTIPFTVQAGQTTTINVPRPEVIGSEQNVRSGIRNWAMNIHSDDPISVRAIYYIVAGTDALLGFPVRSFGTDYRIATFGGSPTGLYSRAVIIADEDNTQVTFTAVKQLEIEEKTVLPGEQYSITLNRGEDFHLRPLPYGHDLSGTGITADKPIGVYSGHDCAFIPRGGIGWCNRTVDQLPSIDLWKTSYLTTPLRTRYEDIFQVLAAYENTEVSVNGVFDSVLEAGESTTFELSQASEVSGNKPILVLHYSAGQGWDQSERLLDPFADLRQQAHDQAEFWAADQYIEIDSAPAPNYAFVLMPQDSVDGLVVDGIPVDPDAFGVRIRWDQSQGPPLPAENMRGVQIALSPGLHRFTAAVAFGLYKNTEGLYKYADPSMAVVPAVDNYMSAYAFQTPTAGIARHFINVTVPTASLNDVILDGQTVDPAHFSPLGATRYSYARLGVNHGGHYISASEPFGLLSYGFDDADAYMYPGGWAFNQTEITASLVVNADTANPLVNGQVCLDITALNGVGEPIPFAQIDLSIAGANPDQLRIATSQGGSAQHCYVGFFTGADQITADSDAIRQTSEVNWRADIGNDTPAITSASLALAADGGIYKYDVAAFDADGDFLTYSLLDGPAGMTIDAVSGVVSWNAVHGNYPVSIRVIDTVGASAQQDYMLLVNRVPVLDLLPVEMIVSDYRYVSRVAAIDPDGDQLYYTIGSGNADFAIDSRTGEISSYNVLPTGNYPLTIGISDRRGGVLYHSYTLVVSGINTAPILSPSQTNFSVSAGDILNFDLNVFDANGDDVLVSVIANDLSDFEVGPTTGQATWASNLGDVGTHQVTVVARDAWGAESAPLTLELTAEDNLPPVITSLAPTVAYVGTLYEYQMVVVDPENQPLAYKVIWHPGFTASVDADGLVSFTPPAYAVNSNRSTIIQVTDSAGHIVKHTISFAVRAPNLFDPQLDSGVPSQAIVGYPLIYQLVGSDGDGSTVDFSLINGPLAMTVSTDGLIAWTPGATQVGYQPVVVRLSDGERALDVNWQIETLLNPLPLAANIGVEPQFVTPGENVLLTVQVVGGIYPSIDRVLLDGAPVTLLNNQATISPSRVGRHEIIVDVLDDGALTSFTSFVSVTDPSDLDAPTVGIESPADGAKISTLTDVIGTVQDANLVDVYLYARRVGSTDEIELYRGADALASQIIGQFDPTLLRNGQYQIVLQATDANNQSAAVQVTVVVVGGMKIGNFNIIIEDLSIPMAGIPIRITRSYDSRRKHENLDFGHGWSIDYQNVSVEESTEPTVGWEYFQELRLFSINGVPTQFPATCMRSDTNKTVTVTLPNDDVEEFVVRLRGVTGSLVADNDPDCNLTASTFFDLYFDPEEGTTSTLEAYANTGMFLLGSGDLVDDIIEVTPSNVTRYRLTTKAGFVYNLDQNFGIEDVSDPNGNTLTYADSGITHSSGKAISFNRDVDGRINRIVDPKGQEITYEYSTQGDLVASIDRESNTTTFEFDGLHNLRDIYDPLGRRLLKNFYDDDGRLIAQEDNYGNRTEFLHDLSGRTSQVTDRLGRITQFAYDERGNVVREVDAVGNLTAYTYDTNDNQLSKTDTLGNTTFSTYDTEENQLTQADELGRVTQFTYNEFGKEVDLTDAQGNSYQNGYDTVGNLVSISDPDGNLLGVNLLNSQGLVTQLADTYDNYTTYTYDGDGNKLTENDALGNIRVYTYDANGNVLTATLRRTVDGVLSGETTAFMYDALDRLIQTTDAPGNVTQQDYDEVGNKVTDTDALGRVTTYTYDAYRRMTRTDYPDGTFTTMVYDAEGNLLSETDANGNVTGYIYDALNRLTSTTYPDGSSAQASYDAIGRTLTETDERGKVTTYAYDAAGQRTTMTGALGHVTTYAYDDNGNLASITDARGNSMQYTYDIYDNRTVTTWPDGIASGEIADRLGRVTSKSDQNGNTTGFSYDALGRLLSVTDALGNVTSYAYDEVGNQLTQTDAAGRVTSWTYDALGRELTRTLPLGQQESHLYDAIGKRISSTDFNGQVTSFDYDNRDRLASVTYNDATVEFFSYDNDGNRIGADDRNQQRQSWGFDSRHRLIQVIDAAGNQIDYQYDVANNKTLQSTTPANTGSGIVTSFAYDALNRLQSVTDANGLITTYAYDANGNRASVTYPNGNATTYVYDANNRLTGQTTRDGTNSVIADYQYTLDPSGHRLQIDEPGRSMVYTYDHSYKLLSENITDMINGNHSTSYEYDAVGNRIYSTTNGVQTMYAYDANDRLLQQGGQVFDYDANGNTLSKTIDRFISSYNYDARNHLSGAQIDNAGEITNTGYQYDVDGIRIQKTEGGNSVDYLIDPNHTNAQVIRESDNGSLVNIDYLYGDDLIQQSQASTNERFYIYDGLGSTRLLSDDTGAITDTYDYEAFGSILNQTGSTENNYQFTGEQYDSVLDQYYLRARYYDQNIARFTQMDTWIGVNGDPLSLHKYLYSGSDPINHIDPSGHFFSLGEVAATLNIRTTLSSIQIDTGMSLLDVAVDPENSGDGLLQGSSIAFGLAAMGVVGGKLLGMLSRKWKDAPDIRYGPHNRGPLATDVVNTFRSATYTQKVLKEPVTLYRVTGSGRALGNFWTRTRPKGKLQNTLDSALLGQFQNSQTNIVKIRVPEKQIIYEGIAARQVTGVTSKIKIGDPYIRQDFPGGGNQVYIKFVDPAWVVK